MAIDSKYVAGMFDNTSKYFKNKIKFLIKKDGTLVVKFDPYFPLKKCENWYELNLYLQRKEYKILNVFITQEFENGKYLNLLFIEGFLREYDDVSNINKFYD